MRITTWNINSINARLDHLLNFINKNKSDIYLLQELKCTKDNFPYTEIENLANHIFYLFL